MYITSDDLACIPNIVQDKLSLQYRLHFTHPAPSFSKLFPSPSQDYNAVLPMHHAQTVCASASSFLIVTSVDLFVPAHSFKLEQKCCRIVVLDVLYRLNIYC